MVSRLIRNQLPGNRLRVRLPCPPLRDVARWGEKGVRTEWHYRNVISARIGLGLGSCFLKTAQPG
jgi:hypothetical protein